MTPHSLAFGIALTCAALIGFAAHRASLCNVRAVAEIMNGGSAHMLGSLLQAALWMATLTGVLVLGFGRALPPVLMPSSMGWALAGGWLFGAGAALNGGCSLSTLHRLADGELGMLATLAGLVLGVLAWAAAGVLHAGVVWLPVVPAWIRWPALAPWLLLALALWALLRVRAFGRLWRSQPEPSLRRRVLAPRYHLSVSAAVMGLAGGLLYATHGAWSYTNHLRTSVLHAWGGGAAAPSGAHSALVIALVGGMAASALQRGSVAWRRPSGPGGWLRHGAGGVLMGAGAAMVPGGNDTLLLNGLPTLALQAATSYLSLLVGIATVLWLMRRTRLPMPAVTCTPAGCSEAEPPPRAITGREGRQ
ncbi:MAG: YeeE/YedE thiosulfate transporter family protein [Piscinibacter sp.]|uniref:YeeE/YedE thiosulfate transporter family protein n=1 Tax=Piscinibacter sp. TaxID=1903157 RepID=UPI003D142D92